MSQYIPNIGDLYWCVKKKYWSVAETDSVLFRFKWVGSTFDKVNLLNENVFRTMQEAKSSKEITMITYMVEPLTDELIKEITPILETHREELQSYKDMKLNPDWHAYKILEVINKLMWLIAREEGVIVGYSLYVISNNLHYKDFLFAQEDVFYVVNDKRGSRIGINLIRKSEYLLKEMGVDVITHHAKFTNNFAPFLERLGYHKTETMLAKRLSDEKL